MWDESKFLADKLTHLSEGEAAYSLREAYKIVIGSAPSNETLAILLAQTALETFRWKSMHNGNWGNVKSKPNDGRYWTMFECGEIINGKEIIFKPPHDQCKFRAYLTPTNGAEDYIKLFLTPRYSRVLTELKSGQVVAYTIALKNAGYFTAGLDRYLVGMKALYNEFMFKMPKLLAWAPPSAVMLPPPSVPDIEEELSSDVLESIPVQPIIQPLPAPPVIESPATKTPETKPKSGIITVAAIIVTVFVAISTMLQNCN